jgi:hypothetical protein
MKHACLKVKYEVEVRDKDGKLISKTQGISRSFLRNWIRILRTMMYPPNGSGSAQTLLDTSGVSNSFDGSDTVSTLKPVIGAGALATEDTYGIQVGTSDLAFAKDQFSLQAKISHGGTSGKLLYGATTVEDYYEYDSYARFRIVRAFSNSTGASITVKEIGIAIVNQKSGTTYYFMISRDVLASPQTIPDGAALTVRYSLYITY